jgi:hypothetical protein
MARPMGEEKKKKEKKKKKKEQKRKKERNSNLTKIILSLNKMKICCFYNSNICSCEMYG